MKKRVIVLVCLIILLPNFIYAYSSGTGVIICGVRYPCDGSKYDGVCPQDYMSDTSTSSVTFSQVMCGGLGANGAITGSEPNTKPIIVDCNNCLGKSTVKTFCSGGDVKSCKFCLNSAKCSQYASAIENCPNSGICSALSGMLSSSSVSGTVYLSYSLNNDRDGEGKSCGVNTDCCGYCSFGLNNMLSTGHCCYEGRYWDDIRQECRDANPCGYTPTSFCPYPMTDYRFWTTDGCIYFDTQKNRDYACCPNTEAFGETGIYYREIKYY